MTISILVGDVREKLRTLSADSFDCVVTSPPYWGLRDYGVEGQIGLEPTLGEHLAVMVDVFREVRRVLKPSGVLFLNYGDCYATTPNGRSAADTKAKGTDDRTFRDKPFSTIGPIYGEPHAQGYDTDGTEELDSEGRGSSSRNRGGGRKGSASTRTSGTDAGRALEQARGPLTQILGSMRSLLDRLPSAGFSDQTELQQSSSAILDQAPVAMRGLELLLAALASTNSGSSQPRPADSHLSDIASACLSSLRSCEIGARRFAHMLAEPSGTRQHTAGSASPSEELAHHIQCTVACCSLLASWEYVEPQRPPSGKRITAGENRDDVNVGGWGSRDDSVRWRGGGVLKAKDLCMIPNRLAIALQEDGWWVRSEIIWGKSNPMPESIKDRPGTAHEKIFMLTKSARYFYAAEEVRQGAAEASLQRWSQNVEGSHRANGGAKTNGTMRAVGGPRAKQNLTAAAAAAVGGSSGRRMAGFNDRWDAKEKLGAADLADPRHIGHINHEHLDEVERGSRSLRNYEPAPPAVWVMGTSPFSDAHFATFPPELVERCLKAGCPPKCCSKCGAAFSRKWTRDATPPEVAPSEVDRFGTGDSGTHRKIGGQYQKWLDEHPLTASGGWLPTCECGAEAVAGRVLDPFGGAGTTALVADQMQLDCTIIELNPDYVHIAVKRLEADRGGMQNVIDPIQIDMFKETA